MDLENQDSFPKQYLNAYLEGHDLTNTYEQKLSDFARRLIFVGLSLPSFVILFFNDLGALNLSENTFVYLFYFGVAPVYLTICHSLYNLLKIGRSQQNDASFVTRRLLRECEQHRILLGIAAIGLGLYCMLLGLEPCAIILIFLILPTLGICLVYLLAKGVSNCCRRRSRLSV